MRNVSLVTLMATALISLNACAAESPAEPAPAIQSSGLTQGTFSGQPVSLSDVQGRCVLTYANQNPLTLDMQWPCRFSEDEQHKLRVESFKQSPILMVERSEHLPAPSKNCKTDRQPVRLYKGKLEAAPVGQIAACGPAHWDQKAFIAFFDW